MNLYDITCNCNECNNTWIESVNIDTDLLDMKDDQILYHLYLKFSDKPNDLILFLIQNQLIPDDFIYYTHVDYFINKFGNISSLYDELKIDVLSELYKKCDLEYLEKQLQLLEK